MTDEQRALVNEWLRHGGQLPQPPDDEDEPSLPAPEYHGSADGGARSKGPIRENPNAEMNRLLREMRGM